jgi:hypothetical protein
MTNTRMKPQAPPVEDMSSSGESSMLIMDASAEDFMMGQFREERKQKYQHVAKPCEKWTLFSFLLADTLYTLFILGVAIYQAQNLTGVFMAYETWLIIVAIRTAMTLGWAIAASVCADKNRQAVAAGATELPCPEAYITVTWWWMQLAAWAIALGFFAAFYWNVSNPDTNNQDQSFLIKLFIIIVACIISGMDVWRYMLRVPLDKILIRSKSNCHDC